MTHVQHLRPFLRKTPFHEPMEALMHGNGWIRWMGFYSPSFFDSVQSEYFATRTGATVYDVSPLIKYSIRGADAAKFMNFLVTRDITKVKPMQAAYTAWCDDDGKMIEEGTIFPPRRERLHPECGFAPAPLAARKRLWLRRGDRRNLRLVLRPLAARPDFARHLAGAGRRRHRDPEAFRNHGDHGRRALDADRPRGFTGDLGYELWVKPESAQWLWDTLFKRGDPFKIAPMGSQALDMVRIEAGFILVDADYIGAMHAIRPTQRESPIEAGIGWAVGLKKDAYFVGKRALQQEKAKVSSRHILMGLEIEGRKPANGAFLYADKAAKQEIGLTTSGMWSPILKKSIAFARVPPAYAKPGTEIWTEIWYPKEKKIERLMARCTVTNRMFFDPPRKKA